MTKGFQDLYRTAFERLGFSLKSKEGIPLAKIAAAEKRLCIRVPVALRDYYVIAGRERILNHAHNRLCQPEDWDIHGGKLIFLEENQWVVVWGVSASSEPSVDPPVYQGPMSDGEPAEWYIEERKCSAFLVFHLHLQAAFGGAMPFAASGLAPRGVLKKLHTTWTFGGEVNGMHAFSRSKQAICFTKWPQLLSQQKTWRIFAGSHEKAILDSIAADLNVRWD